MELKTIRMGNQSSNTQAIQSIEFIVVWAHYTGGSKSAGGIRLHLKKSINFFSPLPRFNSHSQKILH